MSTLKEDLQKMYDLGYSHGHEIAKAEIELKRLQEEIKELK
jgi:hypothetical protein